MVIINDPRAFPALGMIRCEISLIIIPDINNIIKYMNSVNTYHTIRFFHPTLESLFVIWRNLKAALSLPLLFAIFTIEIMNMMRIMFINENKIKNSIKCNIPTVVKKDILM